MTTTNGKTWIITGASSGLGLALAEAALRAGERVVGTARRAGRFDALQARYGDRLLTVEHDVRDTGAGIATEDIYALTTQQANAFTQDQIDAMSGAQIIALIDVMT